MTKLETKIVDSANILITEDNILKHNRELYGDTFHSIRYAIKTGKADEIPPIVVLQNPFDSIDETVQFYKRYAGAVPRRGIHDYEREDEILRETLKRNALLCYNGNRRLEEFQRVGIPIRAFVITSQEEYDIMPTEERRVPERLKTEMPTQYVIDQRYDLSYLGLLDDVVSIEAERRHWDTVLGKL
ncbi:MAG: hypothetical protein HYW24_05400 [Candidatus Aenigmarchaeota archaeon]|nr:hypothetical protein [Candidatus Aenigmarchaeota archaeon]